MNDEEKTYKKLIDDLKNLPKVEAPNNFETGLWKKINSSEESKKTGFWEKLFSPARLAPAALAIVSAVIIFFVVDVNSEVMEDPLNIAPRLREDLVVLETSKDIPVELKRNSVRQKEKSEVRSEGMLSKKKDVPQPLTKGEGDDVRLELETKVEEQSLADELVTGRSDSDSYRPKEVTNLGVRVTPRTTTLASEISKADSFEREMKRERDRIENLPVVKSSSDQIGKENMNFRQRNLSSEEKMEVQQLKKQVQSEKSSKTDQKSRKQP